MGTITNTLSSTAISNVFSNENLDQYREYITEFNIPDGISSHADLLIETNLTDLNNNEAYLIYRLISEPEFNPSREVLETTFNARSFEQVR